MNDVTSVIALVFSTNNITASINKYYRWFVLWSWIYQSNLVSTAEHNMRDEMRSQFRAKHTNESVYRRFVNMTSISVFFFFLLHIEINGNMLISLLLFDHIYYHVYVWSYLLSCVKIKRKMYKLSINVNIIKSGIKRQ